MITDAEFALLAREVAARSGMALAPELAHGLELRLAALIRREGFAHCSALIVAARHDTRLWDRISDALLNQETRFFRDRALFNALREDAFPMLFKLRGAGVSLRVLSAGCSTGQEPYSLALQLHGFAAVGEAGGEVVAIDCSERLLEKARSGLFTQFEVQRGLPIRTLIAQFERLDQVWRVSDEVRTLVRFETHNLREDLASLGQFDVVFCCNVLGDMTPSVRASAIAHLAQQVSPNGYLAIDQDYARDAAAHGFAPVGPGLFSRTQSALRAA